MRLTGAYDTDITACTVCVAYGRVVDCVVWGCVSVLATCSCAARIRLQAICSYQRRYQSIVCNAYIHAIALVVRTPDLFLWVFTVGGRSAQASPDRGYSSLADGGGGQQLAIERRLQGGSGGVIGFAAVFEHNIGR